MAPPRPKSNDPLDNLAERIVALCTEEQEVGEADFEEIDERCEKELDEVNERYNKEKDELHDRLEPKRLPLRVERGRLLIEARKLVPARSWEKWCRTNFRDGLLTRAKGGLCRFLLSQSDIRACIALAEAEDPIAAHEAEKANAAARQRKSRAARQSAVTSGNVTAEPAPSPVALSAAIVQDAPLRVAAPEPLTDPSPTTQPEPSVAEIIPPIEGWAFRNLKKTISEWWADADAADRLALGRWFDALRQSDEALAAAAE